MKKILLFTALLSFYFCLKSQIHYAGTMFSGYYDVIPDTLLNYQITPYTDETFGVDLFDDPSKDIEFTARGAVSSGGSAAFIRAASLNPNVYILFGRWDSVYVPANSNWDVTKVAKPLNPGDPINPAGAVWFQDSLYMTDHSGHGGGNKNVNDWIGGDKYLGVKYQNGPEIDYGWVRVQCKKEDSCYIKDLSYSPVGAGIRQLNSNQASIYPNPVQNTFYLKNIDVTKFGVSRLKMTDMCGKELNYVCEINGNSIKVELDKNTMAGCYLLHYSSNENQFIKKLIKTTD
jgi:hypothetical protein